MLGFGFANKNDWLTLTLSLFWMNNLVCILKLIQQKASVRWESFKAFIRGQIISITSSKAKLTFQKAKNLETKIKEIENEYYRTRSAESH